MTPLIYLSIFILICVLIYYSSVKKFDYWRKRNVHYIQPNFFFGNYREYIMLKSTIGELVQSICNKFPDAPYIGAFYGPKPVLIVQDLELLKLITTKDFYYFNSRELSEHTHKELVTQNLFFTYGDRWSVLRQNLTPLFTKSKMKNMFYLVKKCNRDLDVMMKNEMVHKNNLHVNNLMMRYAMDAIMSCVFGVESKTMNVTTDNCKNKVFLDIGNSIFATSTSRALKVIARSIWPDIFYRLGFTMYPTQLNDLFQGLSKDIFAQRNHKPSKRNDFIDLGLQMKETGVITGSSMKCGSEARKLSMEFDESTLVAQCFLMFAGGFETTSTTLSFVLYELAKNKEAQEKAQKEVDDYLLKRNGNLDFDCITELPYLDACISEALRLYPLLLVVTREVIEDYMLPTGLRLEKGLLIHLPVYHLHHNPAHFTEPEKYRPERFIADEKINIKPYSFMPFGEGLRICIGIRLAKMIMFSALVTIFRTYRMELADGMPTSVKLDSRAYVTLPKERIILKFKHRNEL